VSSTLSLGFARSHDQTLARLFSPAAVVLLRIPPMAVALQVATLRL
jgi:hypothetical protein